MEKEIDINSPTESKKEVDEKYDTCCDNSTVIKRIDRNYLKGEIGSVLKFDKGFFYTIKELLLRPGETVRVFIHQDRKRIVRPLLF